MIWAARLARSKALDFDIERMALGQVGRRWFATERDGNFFSEPGEFSFGRRPTFFGDITKVDFAHSGIWKNKPPAAMRIVRAFSGRPSAKEFRQKDVED